ncbi:MAG: hypothetical protein SFT81_02310 [Candidatus Caenarcaniphilales bacterium]|nr:hypothetical protein [Candidatus Caenarcaniphilales bacterium]
MPPMYTGSFSPFGALSRGVASVANIFNPDGENKDLNRLSKIAYTVGDVADGLHTLGIG